MKGRLRCNTTWQHFLCLSLTPFLYDVTLWPFVLLLLLSFIPSFVGFCCFFYLFDYWLRYWGILLHSTVLSQVNLTLRIVFGKKKKKNCFCSVAKFVSNCLPPHGQQHARLPCSSPSPRVFSDSCPLSQWCYLAISSSATHFSFAFSVSPNQGLFQWVGSSHQVAKALELQLQPQSFQWIFSVDFF